MIERSEQGVLVSSSPLTAVQLHIQYVVGVELAWLHDCYFYMRHSHHTMHYAFVPE